MRVPARLAQLCDHCRKVTLGKDIRNYGSGNASLTNAYRTMGAKRRCSFCSVTLPRVPQRFRSAGRSAVRSAS
ncbi:MAG: glycerol-3-phosphate acyltransferase [Butyricicoccus sp.]